MKVPIAVDDSKLRPTATIVEIISNENFTRDRHIILFASGY
ncbi:hypothetical protein BH10CYA1_BH10CYA1_36510 [soil metagenome]